MAHPIPLRPRFFGALVVLALAWACVAVGAAQASPLGDLDPDDLAVVEALSLYDEGLRRDALEAAGEADVLGALVRQQERSSATFRQLLEPYERQVQEDLFELARYPELVSEIVEGGPKSQKQLEAIGLRYPDEVSAAAARTGRDYWKVIARTDALMRDETAAFEAAIAHLPERKRDAFRSLVSAPDVLALLAENTGVAVLLGDAYEREPDEVLAWLEDLEREVSERGSEEARELAQTVEEDAELADEIAASTEAYQDATGYSAYASPPVHHTSVTVNISPFPYWIGYPWWYASSYSYYDPWYFWYPRVAWSFGGVHFGPRFHVSFGFGWPHGAFWGWYFHSPSHHSYYPRLTHHVVHHYDRHYGHDARRYRHHDWRRHDSRHGRPGRHAVHRFVRDAQGSMPRGFLRDDGQRIERFREYGRLHEDGGRGGREVRVRRADHRGEVGGDLMRRARADRERYPRLANLSQDPERSRRLDLREAQKLQQRRAARRDAAASKPRAERRGDRTERGDERGKADRQEPKAQQARRTERPEAGVERPPRERRVERDERGRSEVNKRGDERGRERRAELRRDAAPPAHPRAERRRDEAPPARPRAERQRDEAPPARPRAERQRDEPRVERRAEPRAERAPRRVERSAPQRSRGEARPHRGPGNKHRGGHGNRRGRGRGRR